MNPLLAKYCLSLSITAITVFSLTFSGVIYGANKKILHLSEKDVLKEVLSSGPFIQKIKLTKQKNLSHLLEKKYSFSQWGTFSSLDSISKEKTLKSPFLKAKRQEDTHFTLGLKKNIPLWTQV